MPKKKKEDKIVSLVPKTEEAPKELSQEEIDYVMKRDEDELDSYLNKFKAVALPDSSKVEEDEEDEEETITLDFTEEGVKAYEKVGEGVAVRDENGNISLVDDEKLADRIKEVLQQDEEPKLKRKYHDLIHDTMVSKAIASLVNKLHNAQYELASGAQPYRMGVIGDVITKEIEDSVYAKRMELRAAIAGGKVHYDKIPTWAEGYIEEYLMDAVYGLLQLTERG